MSRIEALVAPFEENLATAQLLLVLGHLKQQAQGWMVIASPEDSAGVSYARARPEEFALDSARSRFVYKGNHYPLAASRAPNDSLIWVEAVRGTYELDPFILCDWAEGED